LFHLELAAISYRETTETMTTALPFDPHYIMAARIMDKYIGARNKDFLPDVQTENVLGMGGGPVGKKLLGAFKTLENHGRFSRTQIEQALVYSPDHYPGYIKTLICSLPPSSRSVVASELYNNKFNGIQWEMTMYNNLHVSMGNNGVRNFLKPALPLGDDRHSPRMKAIAEIASTFHDAFNYGWMLEDILAPIDPEYPEMLGIDLFDRYGPLFGIRKDFLNLTGSQRFFAPTVKSSSVHFLFSTSKTACQKLSFSTPFSIVLKQWNFCSQME